MGHVGIGRRATAGLVAVMARLVGTAPVTFAAGWTGSYPVPFHHQESQYYCVVASSQMLMGAWGVSPIPGQNTLYVQGRGYTGCSYSSTDYGLDARAWDWLLYLNIPPAYYWDARYQSAKDGTAQALERVSVFKQAQGVEVYHGGHAVVLVGGTMSCDPAAAGCLTGSYTISSVQITDPLQTSSYVQTIDYTSWSNNWYTANTQSDCNIWQGYWVDVLRTSTAMQPGPYVPSTTNLPPDAPPGSGSPVMTPSGKSSTYDPTKPSQPTGVQPLMNPDDPPAPPPVPAVPSAALESAIAGSIADTVVPWAKANDPNSGDAFSGVQLAGPLVFVKSNAPGWPDYYLGRLTGAGGMKAAALWDVSGTAWHLAAVIRFDASHPEYLSMDSATAASLVAQAGYTAVGQAELVWQPSREDSSPFLPMWQVQTATGPVYVGPDRTVFPMLHPAHL